MREGLELWRAEGVRSLPSAHDEKPVVKRIPLHDCVLLLRRMRAFFVVYVA